MDFSIAKLKLNANALTLYDNARAIERQRPFSDWDDVRTLFTWDCNRQQGHPAQPLAPFVAKSYMHFHVVGADGKPDPRAAGQMLDRFVQTSRLRSRRAFSTAFSQVCPDISMAVDEAALIEPYKSNYSFTVIAFAVYHIFVVTPNGGLPGDHAYVAIPFYIYMQTPMTGICNNAPDPGISGLLATGGGAPEYTDVQTALREQALADNKLAIERLRQE